MSIDAFQETVLEDTFVFSWHRGAHSLTFEVLASLSQRHPEASSPVKGEWACYRRGLIRFTGVTAVAGLLPQESIIPTTDPDGSVDFGCIDELSQIGPGEYRIAGEFGVVAVAAQELSIALVAQPN